MWGWCHVLQTRDPASYAVRMRVGDTLSRWLLCTMQTTPEATVSIKCTPDRLSCDEYTTPLMLSFPKHGFFAYNDDSQSFDRLIC